MQLELLLSRRLAHPFKPFTLVLADGRRLPVDVPYRLGISPRGNEIGYASDSTGAMFIPLQDVKDVEDGVSRQPTGAQT